jgi:hypothetical protein
MLSDVLDPRLSSLRMCFVGDRVTRRATIWTVRRKDGVLFPQSSVLCGLVLEIIVVQQCTHRL